MSNPNAVKFSAQLKKLTFIFLDFVSMQFSTRLRLANQIC